MTRMTRCRLRKIAEVKRRWQFLHHPTPAEHVFRIHELWFSTFKEADVIGLLRYRQLDASAVGEADDEMRRRRKVFMSHVVQEERVDELLNLLRDHGAGFAGYEVLKMFVPACEERVAPTHRIFTLFTPFGDWHHVRDWFFWIGFRVTHANGVTLEQRRSFYGNSIADSINMHSPDGRVFIDIIESVNDVACYPSFRMATTLHIHCLFADYLFAPYGQLSCQKKGIINPALATGDLLLTLRPGVQELLDRLQSLCVVELHRNANLLSPHDASRCGIDTNCPHTIRSTASIGSVIYPFTRQDIANDTTLRFLPHDGVIWRLGGWSCYAEGSQAFQPTLILAPDLHKSFDGQELGHQLQLASNASLLRFLGWK